MTVREVFPNVDANALLAGAQFMDAYRVVASANALTARQATERMLMGPRWIGALMRLRNIIVAPLGLKTSGEQGPSPGGLIGMFPVVSETPERVVAGFNDVHLDFRVVVDVAPIEGGRQVTATTLVLTHNPFGRTYLALVLPFHRRIVRSMLRQVAAGCGVVRRDCG
ncbi:MAG: DUF2867 domain-containing protein [Bradyrhizobium sp.]|uniref:DUF2867 domain-containing protein n=1 Tax=Bradyrhizobium sp. TaxID=376 RepID=UPI0025BE1C1E|nr:DUF2867 domain-containing protein [Bradyrhizobium sp.]MBI5265382.1 DUF2867 domain-containing protein [Bradyrhizobium sp.]